MPFGTVKSGMPVDIRFKSIIRALVVGPSMSGKSVFAYHLIKHRHALFELPPKRVVVFYAVMQPLYTRMMEEFGDLVVFEEGLPNEDRVQQYLGDDAPQPQLFLVDDFTLAMDKTVANIYNVLSHHNKLHIVSLVHRLFSKLPHFRDISMACSHLCLKKNPRDLSEYQILARQLHPTNPAAFMAMFKHATARGFGYLLCDLTQTCKDTERFLTNILPEEYPPILYILDNTAAAPK